MAVFTQNQFPLEYSPKIEVVPSDPDRLPYVPVQILYLIAQALPQPSQVFNLARVNKETWNYLQPALYECEVTYEARLVAHFGDGRRDIRRVHAPNVYAIFRIDNSEEDHGDAENDDQLKAKCAHGLVTALCEMCGKHIAIEEKDFTMSATVLSMTDLSRSDRRQKFFQSDGMTALHWACGQGDKALPVARKAIEAAKAHQPEYIDGLGLRMRRIGDDGQLSGEIPPPLFTAAAFGNTELCKALVEAGCKVNVIQPRQFATFVSVRSRHPQLRIHESCVPHPRLSRACQWQGATSLSCRTAGNVALEFGRVDVLESLLDHGLDPLMGKEPLIHLAARACDLPAIKILLDRFPEMATHPWDGMTPLHVLCWSSRDIKEDEHSLEELKSVAGYLLQKGANLETEGGMTGLEPSLTPLQYAVTHSVRINSNKSHAAEALVMLGAVWNRYSSTRASANSILNLCVHEAALREPVYKDDGRGGKRSRAAARQTQESLTFAKVVKAMVKSIPTSVPDPALVPGSQPPMEAFLGAFRSLAVDRDTVARNYLDPFAIEAVGRLLLSTGIATDHDDIENWRLVIASNTEGQRGTDWATSPWRELISDLPETASGE